MKKKSLSFLINVQLIDCYFDNIYCAGPEEEKVLGSLLLPGYTIRPCLAGDRDRFVYRKYAFKAEHRNTRSFYLAADSRPAMIQWMNALSLAAILQDSTSLLAST